MPPAPHAPWTGTRDCFQVGNRAPQDPDGPISEVFALDRQEPMGEDCLNLNVFTPALTGNRPVMVWLHGGGFALVLSVREDGYMAVVGTGGILGEKAGRRVRRAIIHHINRQIERLKSIENRLKRGGVVERRRDYRRLAVLILHANGRILHIEHYPTVRLAGWNDRKDRS
jgi:hypothetical protein